MYTLKYSYFYRDELKSAIKYLNPYKKKNRIGFKIINTRKYTRIIVKAKHIFEFIGKNDVLPPAAALSRQTYPVMSLA